MSGVTLRRTRAGTPPRAPLPGLVAPLAPRAPLPGLVAPLAPFAPLTPLRCLLRQTVPLARVRSLRGPRPSGSHSLAIARSRDRLSPDRERGPVPSPPRRTDAPVERRAWGPRSTRGSGSGRGPGDPHGDRASAGGDARPGRLTARRRRPESTPRDEPDSTPSTTAVSPTTTSADKPRGGTSEGAALSSVETTQAPQRGRAKRGRVRSAASRRQRGTESLGQPGIARRRRARGGFRESVVRSRIHRGR